MMMQPLPQPQLKNAFEVLVSEQYIVLKRGVSSLWFSRSPPTPTNAPVNLSAAFSPKAAPVPEFRLLKEGDPSTKTLFADFTCHGLAYGLIGLFLADKLLLIRAAASVGRLPFATKDEVFKVAKICVVGLCSRGEMVGDLGLDKCTQDSCTKPVLLIPSPNEPFALSASFSKLQQQDSSDHQFLDSSSASLNLQPPAFQSTSLAAAAAGAGAVQKTWNQIKQTASKAGGRVGSAGADRTGSSSSTSAAGASSSSTGGAVDPNGNNSSRQEERDKFERRFIDELYKMFNETNSFYFSWTGDLTQSVQRQQKQRAHFAKTQSQSSNKDIRAAVPLWKRVDDRFFWNRYMLKSVVEAFESTSTSSTAAAAQQVTPTNDKPESPEVPTTTSEEDLLRTYSHLWVLPIIQGFVQIEKCYFDLAETSPVGGVAATASEANSFGDSQQQQPKTSVVINNSNGSQNPSSNFLELGRDYYLMTLISRRSRFRAGTRYKRRGLDEEGRCANYVETEQIFSYGTHTVAFVLVRGSVPLFWSQVGSKYRPPPRLERTEAENQTAFRRHFEHEFAIYEGDSVVVSLIEQTGREKILGDAFLEHVIRMDDARLAYVAFDFHDYCRGMRFENVSLLIDRIYEFIKDIRYCWVDEDGMICEQRGVFRINCIDCLDRTNIVMTAIAKAVMDIQLVRLGLLPPEGQLPANSRRIFQLMWAHNGDTISRQYAGTAALKGDFTRTGERKISGVVRDGVNSANRYYLNRFKDAYRQAVIDIMQGQAVAEALSSPENEKGSSTSSFLSAVSGGVLSKSGSSSSISGMASSTSATTSASLSVNDPEYHERIKLVIEDCKKILVPQEEVILGGWPLVDADPVTGTPLSSVTRSSASELPDSEMDTVLILTKDCYYVADYDDQTDRVVKYQKVALEDLEKIELGAEPNYSSSGGPFSRGSSSSSSSRGTPLVSYALRLHYSIAEQTGYYHVFRSTGTRFFNNMAIPIRTREEALESLKAIAESFKVALSVKQCNVPFHELSRLEKRKSRRLYGSTGSGSGSSSEPTSAVGGRFRNVIGGGGGGVGGVGIPETSSGGAPRKLLTGMYSSFSRVLRGKIGAGAAGLQLDGLAVTGGGNKSSSEDHEQQQQQQVQIKVGGNSLQNLPPEGEGMMIEEEEEEEEEDVDIEEDECSEDESCASSASESTASNILLKSGNRNRNSKNRPNTASSSSSLVVELPTSTRGSALSCSSELLSESELDLGCASCSELMLPPISELGSPVDDQDLIDGGRLYGLGGGREHMDRVLESCGILVTSPPLIRVGGNSREATPTEHYHRAHSSRSPSPPGNYSSSSTAAKGVFADVDDFVLDSMKKASLRQLHRKAVSSVSLSGGGGGGPNNGSKSPKVSTEKPQKVPASSSSASSDRSRCIFSSELALNSIVSQSIKRDISYDDVGGPGKGLGAGGLKSLSSSLSTDAINGGGTNTSSASNNQQMKAALLLNSSLSYAGDLSKQEKYEQQREFDQIKSFTDTMRNFIAAAEDHELNRANLDSAMLLASAGAMSHGSGSKESSLSVSDLAVLGSLGGGGGGGGGGGSSISSGSGVSGAGGGGLSGGGGGLKTSLSSTTLLNSGPMSLNLPNFHPHNSNSLHLNSCASSISISGMGGGGDDGDHHRNLNIPSIIGGGGSASSSGASTAASAASSSSFTSSFMVKKDLVLSPLTRIAQKGMQSLGLNLRSRNATGGGGGEVVVDPELAKRKQQTRSRIIEI